MSTLFLIALAAIAALVVGYVWAARQVDRLIADAFRLDEHASDYARREG